MSFAGHRLHGRQGKRRARAWQRRATWAGTVLTCAGSLVVVLTGPGQQAPTATPDTLTADSAASSPAATSAGQAPEALPSGAAIDATAEAEQDVQAAARRNRSGAPAPAATSSSAAVEAPEAPEAAPAPTSAKASSAAPEAPVEAAVPAPPVAAASTAGTQFSGGANSGLGWASGVYVPGSSPSEVGAFAAWRGKDLDVVVDWAARSNWSDVTNPSWLYDAWKGTSYTVAMGVAMIPEDGSASIGACAQGAYAGHWREFGSNLQASGMAGRTVVRLGWEFNGDWYAWSAYDPTAWAACWRAIVGEVRKAAPAVRFDWSVNRGNSQALSDPRAAWPGDAYVDIVGIDSYDMWPGVRSEADWEVHSSDDYGLGFWVDFARQHGKKVSVPEWGVYPGTAHAGHNGGDNPLYIEKMVQFFRSLGSDLAYEAYFNEPASYIASSLHGPGQNPQAAAAYQELY